MPKDFEKTEPLLRPEDIYDVDKTQEFKVPEELGEQSVENITDRAKTKEREMKLAIAQSLESVLGGPVYVDSIEYLGEGQFQVMVSVVRGRSSESHTVIVQEPEKKFE